MHEAVIEKKIIESKSWLFIGLNIRLYDCSNNKYVFHYLSNKHIIKNWFENVSFYLL